MKDKYCMFFHKWNNTKAYMKTIYGKGHELFYCSVCIKCGKIKPKRVFFKSRADLLKGW